jgi:hypothetical protein
VYTLSGGSSVTAPAGITGLGGPVVVDNYGQGGLSVEGPVTIGLLEMVAGMLGGAAVVPGNPQPADGEP